MAVSVEERPWWKLYGYGWQNWHLAALEHNFHEAKLKDQYYFPHNTNIQKLAKPSLENRLQARERIYHELITIGHLSSDFYKTPVW